MREDFDKEIKDALSGIERPYNPKGWDDLSSRLDEEDQLIDETMKSSIANLEPAFQASHWQRMQEWLDYAWYIKNKYFISKSAEAVLILLALFTFFNYQHQTNTHAPTETAESPLAQLDKQSTKAITQTETAIAQTDITTEAAIPQSTDAFEKSGSNKVTQLAEAPASSSQTTRQLRPTQDESSSSAKPFASTSARSDIRLNKTALETPVMDSKAQPTEETAAPVPFRLNQSPKMSSEQNRVLMPFLPKANENTKATNAKPIAGLTPQSIQPPVDPLSARMDAVPAAKLVSLNTLNNPVQQVDNAPIIDIKRVNRRPWSVSAFTDMNFNSIRTPYDGLYEKSGYNQNRVGIGGGFQVHRQIGPVEVSTGAIYASKQYSPKEFIELFKKNEDSEGTHFIFDGVHLNILTVPLHTSYYIHNSNGWRTYAVAGGAVHMAMQAEYEREYFTVAEDQLQRIAVQVESQNGTVTEGRTPNFEIKKFPNGLLEDGSVKDNLYFTLDIGIGIERQLTHATALFVQPTVFYNLFNKGLSANDDIINTFSLQVGMKTRL